MKYKNLTGETMYYRETGDCFEVEVLEHQKTEGEERFKLKIIEIINESPMFKPSEIGEKFEVSSLSGEGVNCGWTLSAM
jgi:hypothetical protein